MLSYALFISLSPDIIFGVGDAGSPNNGGNGLVREYPIIGKVQNAVYVAPGNYQDTVTIVLYF